MNAYWTKFATLFPRNIAPNTVRFHRYLVSIVENFELGNPVTVADYSLWTGTRCGEFLDAVILRFLLQRRHRRCQRASAMGLFHVRHSAQESLWKSDRDFFWL